jgi:NTP pyrophosphatase (non-canonical NTP hydrolase)
LLWIQATANISTEDAMAVGIAHAMGIPAFCSTELTDLALRTLVTVVPDLESAVRLTTSAEVQPRCPVVTPFQRYYDRIARFRGYATESARDCLLLLTEEVGELARAIRKVEGLVRHGVYPNEPAHELADVFLYTIHLANILGIDLARSVEEKECENAAKFNAPTIAVSRPA